MENKKPCDTCITNIEQAILYDEVTCYHVCKEWQDWRNTRLNYFEKILERDEKEDI